MTALVFAELDGDGIADASLRALTLARGLGVPVAAAVFGDAGGSADSSSVDADEFADVSSVGAEESANVPVPICVSLSAKAICPLQKRIAINNTSATAVSLFLIIINILQKK